MTSAFETLWQEVESMPNPGSAPTPEDPQISLDPDVRRYRRLLDIRFFALTLVWIGYPLGAALSFVEAAPSMIWGIAAITLPAHFYVLLIPTDTSPFKKRLADAEAYWKYVQSEWEDSAGPTDLETSTLRLLSVRNRWKTLPSREQQKIDELEGNHWESQLLQFLAQYRVEDARIFNIADGRGKSLQQAKVQTAADITEESLARVQGIGPTLTRALLEWRRGLESQFQYDPSQPISASDIQKIKNETADEANELELELQMRLADHRRILARIHNVRAKGLPLLNSAYRTYRVALLELATVGGK